MSMTLSSGLSSFYKSRTHVLDGFYSCCVLCSEEPFRSLCYQWCKIPKFAKFDNKKLK